MKFEMWFKAQFGQVPMSLEKRRKLSDKERDARNEADMIRGQLERDELLTERWRAALRAWECNDKYKEQEEEEL